VSTAPRADHKIVLFLGIFFMLHASCFRLIFYISCQKKGEKKSLDNIVGLSQVKITNYFYLLVFFGIVLHRGGPRCIQGHVPPSRFWKIMLFDNLSPPEIFFYLLDCLIILRKKIFNTVHNEIIMQRYQNIKFLRRKLSSTWLSITLRFILLLF
jgi:hypothetical protein